MFERIRSRTRRRGGLLVAAVSALAASGCAYFAIPDPPILEAPLTFPGAGGTPLAGTLAGPASRARVPAVLLIGGAAERDRDQVLAGFPTFAALAHALATAGVATLRIDDRGTGESGGSTRSTSLEDLVLDATAALDALARQEAIDQDHLMVLAHGEGSLIGARIAARDPRVCGLILMAGLCVPVRDAWLSTYESELALRRLPAPEFEERRDQVARFLDALLSGSDRRKIAQELRAQVVADYERSLAENVPKDDAAADPLDFAQFEALAFESRLLAAAERPTFRDHAASDPTGDLAGVRAPILALFGGLDRTVDARRNRAAIMAIAAGRPLDVEVLPNATHTFQAGRSGVPSEYATLIPAYVDGFSDRIAAWILGLRPAAEASGRQARAGR